MQNSLKKTAGLETVRVDVEGHGYDIIIAEGLLSFAGEWVKKTIAAPRVIIITDSNVAPHYLKPLEQSLAASGIRHDAIVVNAGEGSKSFGGLQELLEKLLDLRPERSTTLIALGGGVVGDLVGCAASLLLRGVSFIQIPTTLLSQVDSSVGGKTGINTRQGKNLVGTFHQPILVLTDILTLRTLPRRECAAGYAEVVKYGLLGNKDFFAWLEQNGKQVLAGDAAALGHAIATSCRMKADIVARDEKEKNVRALLNLGHTFAHALEAETGYSDKLLHGEAVAIGMVLAAQLSALKGLLKEADVLRIKNHLSVTGLPVSPLSIQPTWNVDALVRHCHQDKKVRDGKLTFVLLKEIGQAIVSQDINDEMVGAVLAESLRIA